MKLINQKIRKELEKYPLYSQDGKKKDAVAVCKFFMCAGAWTWYIMEADMDIGCLYGITINGEGGAEYGYLDLNELQNLKTSKGLRVERDITFVPCELGKIRDSYLQDFLNRLYDE